MNDTISGIDERYCPICNNINNCGVKKNEDCWCFHTNIPQELQNQISAELRGKACICLSCVEEFKRKMK